MATTYASSAVQQPTHGLRREPSRWRLRLSRFIRGQRRQNKAAAAGSVSATAPRLAPIGDEAAATAATAPKTTYTSIADNFASLKFDDQGELSNFNFSFDAKPESAPASKREPTGGSEREPGLLDVVTVKRQSKSAAGERPVAAAAAAAAAKGHTKAPSVDLPRDDANGDHGFFDSWLLNAVQEGRLAELEDKENEEPSGTVSKRQSRTPIASQYATVAPPIASQFTSGSRPASIAVSSRGEALAQSAADDKSKSPGQKRKADDDAPTSPSKRGSMIRSDMSSASLTSRRQSQENVGGAYKRHSVNLDETRGRCPPVSIKRYSMGSDYGSDNAYSGSAIHKRLSGANLSVSATKADNRRPSAVPSLIDSESNSSASTSPTMATAFASVTTARRFEIKTASLLTPVTNAIADKQNANISETISRINNGTAARSTGDRPLERSSSSRCGSRSRMSGYAGGSRSASPAGLSRTSTPEPSMYPDATPRARRPSSRLSDRMSWLRELDDANGKQTGRDFVFRKMEGGVAAKLAAFEHKKAGAGTGAQTPSAYGHSRSNSIASRQCSSELYGIEPKLTRRATADGPGSISNVVDDDFKQKLESMTGFMAEKLNSKSGNPQPQTPAAVAAASSSSSSQIRGPAAMGAARSKIPQDVLDFIALSGVDPEVAINEYMQQGGALGKTRQWQHDEILKQINQLEQHEPTSAATTPTKDKTPAATEQPASRAAAAEAVAAPPPMSPTKQSLPAANSLLSPAKSDVLTPQATPAKLENARAVLVKPAEMPRTIQIRAFNAAALPRFVSV